MPDTYALHRLYFYLTEGCNLACRHCWLAPRFDPTGGKVLQPESFRTAISEALPLGLSAVKLTGGEPLLHPQFRDFLGIIRRENLALSIESNGLLCSPEIASEIAACPNPSVSISIDGADAPTNDRIRGVSGAFEKTVRAVENLVHAGIRPQIIMSLMPENAAQLDDIVRLSEDLNADSVKFNIVQPVARGQLLRRKNQALSVAEIIRVGRYVENELSARSPVRLHFDYPLAFRPLSRIASGEASQVCGILGIMGVIPGGHYALCGIGTHLPELVFGSVGRDDLAGIWEKNPVLRRLREGLPRRLEGVCGRCLMKSRCLGSCIAQTVYRSNSLWSPFWFCEEAERQGLFPASRLIS